MLALMIMMLVCASSSAWLVVPCARLDRWPDEDRHEIPEMMRILKDITPVELTVEDVWLQVTDPVGWEVAYSAEGANAPGVHNRARLLKLVRDSLRGKAYVRSSAIIGVKHSRLKVIIDTNRGERCCVGMGPKDTTNHQV